MLSPVLYDITQDIKERRYLWTESRNKNKPQLFGRNIYLKFRTGIIKGLLKHLTTKQSIIIYVEIYVIAHPNLRLIIKEYPLFDNIDPKLMMKAIRKELKENPPIVENIEWSFNPQDLIHT